MSRRAKSRSVRVSEGIGEVEEAEEMDESKKGGGSEFRRGV